MPGMNFKNLKDLNTRNTLKIKKKLRFDKVNPKIHEIIAGIESMTKQKSSLFQPDLK